MTMTLSGNRVLGSALDALDLASNGGCEVSATTVINIVLDISRGINLPLHQLPPTLQQLHHEACDRERDGLGYNEDYVGRIITDCALWDV